MEPNARNLRKKAMERTSLPATRVIISSRRLEEMYASVKNDEGPAIPVKNLSENLASVLLDCHVKDEQAKMINDSILERLSEYEKSQRKMEGLLKESSRQIGNLALENSNLTKALSIKDKMIDDLHKIKTQVDEESKVLICRLDSTEKENSFVKYEYRMVEKELEVRNEELEYNRLFVDKSRKNHLESVKKMTDLEAECQRLRLLVRKRLPDLSNMKTETRRNKKNLTRDLILRDNNQESFTQIHPQQIDMIIDQLQKMEEENKCLKEIIMNKTSEHHSSRIMHSLSKDGLSSSRTWDNPLVSEFKKLGTEKLGNLPEAKALDFSDMSLMDDFVEMEKLALVCVETPHRSRHVHGDRTGKELLPVERVDSSSCDIKREIHSKGLESGKPFDWLQVVLNAMSEQSRISNRSTNEIFRDIKIALGYVNHPDFQDADDFNTALYKVSSRESCKSEIKVSQNAHGDGSSTAELDRVPTSEKGSLKDELKIMESGNINDEARFEPVKDKAKLLTMQLQESRKSIGNLQAEVKALKELKGRSEEEIENQKLINEDLDTQLSVAKAKLKEAFLKFSSLEVELEDKSNSCEELEATCLELQLQLESIVMKETPVKSIDEEGKHTPNGWEITVASSKLAECQETILNLGKQLKALAPPREAVLFEKVLSTTTPSIRATNQNNPIKRASLRNRMLAEDDTKSVILKSNKAKMPSLPSKMESLEADLGSKKKGSAPGTVAVVSSRRQGGLSLLQKLLLKRKNSSSKRSRSIAKT